MSNTATSKTAAGHNKPAKAAEPEQELAVDSDAGNMAGEAVDGGANYWRWIRNIFPVFLVAVICWSVAGEFRNIDTDTLLSTTESVSFLNLIGLLCIAFCAVSAMLLYDLSLRQWLRLDIPVDDIVRYSWIANSVNNMAGFSGLTGTGLRIMLLRRHAVPVPVAATYAIIIFIAMPLGVGVLSLLTLLLKPDFLFATEKTSLLWWASLWGFGLFVPVYLLLLGRGPLYQKFLQDRPPLLWRWRLLILSASVINWSGMALTLWCCLAAVGSPPPLVGFIGAFALAAGLGTASFIPGGLGVFDGTLLVALVQQGIPGESVLAALLLYRGFYYLLPMLVGVYLGGGLLATEGQSPVGALLQRVVRLPGLRTIELPNDLARRIGLRMFSILLLLIGIGMLFTGALPVFAMRSGLLLPAVPTAVVEFSYLATISIGVWLIGTSRGLAEHVIPAYKLSKVLLLAGTVFSLLKGAHWAQAASLFAVYILLWGGAKSFDRRTYPTQSGNTLVWLLLLSFLILLYWLTGSALLSDVSLHSALNNFAVDAYGPRFARSVLVAILSAVGFTVWRLSRARNEAHQ